MVLECNTHTYNQEDDHISDLVFSGQNGFDWVCENMCCILKTRESLILYATTHYTLLYDSRVKILYTHLCLPFQYKCPRPCEKMQSLNAYSIENFYALSALKLKHRCCSSIISEMEQCYSYGLVR